MDSEDFQVDARFTDNFSNPPPLISLQLEISADAEPFAVNFEETYYLKLVEKPCTKTMTIPMKFEKLKKIVK